MGKVDLVYTVLIYVQLPIIWKAYKKQKNWRINLNYKEQNVVESFVTVQYTKYNLWSIAMGGVCQPTLYTLILIEINNK